MPFFVDWDFGENYPWGVAAWINEKKFYVIGFSGWAIDL